MKLNLKKNVMQGIEKIKENRKISREVEKEIFVKIIANWALGIAMLILIFTFLICGSYLERTLAINIFNISSIIFLISSLTVIEIAYKKDSGKLAITGVEILVLAVFTLFAPYIFIDIKYSFIYFTLAVITIYYGVKTIKTYCDGKNKYLNNISDITDIIKKESKDELAIQEKEKQRKVAKQEQPKKKKTTTKRNTTAKKTAINKNAKKNTTNKESK